MLGRGGPTAAGSVTRRNTLAMASTGVASLETRHEDMIVSSSLFVLYATFLSERGCFRQHDAQLDYYGKRLATCSSDRSVKVRTTPRVALHTVLCRRRQHREGCETDIEIPLSPEPRCPGVPGRGRGRRGPAQPPPGFEGVRKLMPPTDLRRGCFAHTMQHRPQSRVAGTRARSGKSVGHTQSSAP